MIPLFDMLANAQNGKGIDLLSRQFNLTRQQTELALEALLPAFSQGLKRNASDPYGMAGFMTALASGQHGQYFDNAARAFSPDGMADGNGILGHLFGSKDLSRAVASQAAQATGIGEAVLKQMLPAIAAMLMGGMFNQSTSQGGKAQGGQAPAGPFGAGNPFGEIIERMMRAGGMAPKPEQQTAPDPFDNPFGKVLKDMFGGGVPAAGDQRRQESPAASNPFGKIFEEMLGGGKRAAEPEPQDEPNPSGRPRNPYDEALGNMFETGRKTRDDYQRGVETIFDQFLKGMDQPRQP
jgi:hypothetical protein